MKHSSYEIMLFTISLHMVEYSMSLTLTMSFNTLYVALDVLQFLNSESSGLSICANLCRYLGPCMPIFDIKEQSPPLLYVK